MAAAILALVGGEIIPTEYLTESGCQTRNGECVHRNDCTNVTLATPRCDKKGLVCCGASTNRATFMDTDLDYLDDEDLTRSHMLCNDKRCSRFQGSFTAPGACSGHWREIMYCSDTDQYCCVPPCQEKSECLSAGGFCVTKKSDCPGRTKNRWCHGRKCTCCIAERADPFKYKDSHDIDICGDVDTFDLLGGAIVNIHTPNYPYSYPPNMTCSLTITHASHLHFNVYVIESSLDTCSHDTLTFSDYSLCGKTSPAVYSVDADSVTFSFVSDYIESNFGFFAMVTAECASGNRKVPDPQYRTNNYYSMCTDSIITETTGLINSYNHPCNYLNYQSCTLDIQVPNGYVVNFTYIDFELEDYYCYYDYFQIYDVGFATGLDYCSTNAPSFTLSATNHVRMAFYSDSSVTFTGFLIYFNAVLP